MIFLPVLGSVLEAAGMIFEKKILKVKGMNFKNYTVFEFLSIVLTMLPVLYYTWRISQEAFETFNLLWLGTVILISILANLLIFYSLKRENITEFEPIWLMQPLFTVLLAIFMFPTERNWIIVGLALIASLTLIFAHVKKHHLRLDKYIFAALIGSFLFALELVISKPLLEFYSPFTFYFIRCFFIFVITLLLFRPSMKILKGKTVGMIVLVGIMWFVYRAIIYWGYESLGIIYTTILFILSPVLMLIFAVIFLKEKPTARQIIANGIILVCVLLAVLIHNG
jgi:drug/metabolite transporter (DMT)-like permease